MFQCIRWTTWSLYVTSINILKQYLLVSKWFLHNLGYEGLHKLLAGFDDKSAYTQCVLGYLEKKDDQPKIFVGKNFVIL